MSNTQKTVGECRIQKVADNMTTTKKVRLGLNTFDDKRLYVNNIPSYPHDENLYLFEKDFVNKIIATSLVLDNDQLANNILEITINDGKMLMKAAIRLYNNL